MPLTARRDLTIFTNSVISCGKLMGHNGNRVHMLGGEVQPINGATLGRDTTAMLSNYLPTSSSSAPARSRPPAG